MKVTCPKNPNHKRFSVTAHVTEEWVVDEEGNFVESREGHSPEVVHEPEVGDLYTCEECHTQAKSERN